MLRFPSNRSNILFSFHASRSRHPPPPTATALTSLHGIRPPSLLTPSISFEPPPLLVPLCRRQMFATARTHPAETSTRVKLCDKLNLPRRRLTGPTAAALLTTRSHTCGFHPSLRPLQPVPSAPPTPSPLCPTTVVGATALHLLSPNQYNKVAIHALAGLVCGQACTVEQYWALCGQPDTVS